MENENFYVHLTSNVTPTSPDQLGNSIGNYVTRLNRRLNLNEDWEVGVTDISYTKSWYNIFSDQTLLIIDENNQITNMVQQLPAGNYEEIDELVSAINKILQDTTSEGVAYPPQLLYHKQSNKIKIRLGAKSDGENFYLYPHFSKFLADFLGLTDSQGRQYSEFDNKQLEEQINIKAKGTVKPSVPQAPLINQSMPATQQPITTNTTSTHPITTTTLIFPTAPIITTTSNKSPIVTATTVTPSKTSTSEIGGNSVKPYTQIKKPRKLLPGDKVSEIAPHFPGICIIDGQLQSDQPLDVTNKRNVKVFVEGFKEVSLYGTIQSLYVYCNIIKPVLVGNFEAPLIRRVEIPHQKKFGETCEINYNQPQYYPLVSHEIDSIEVDIKDDTDRTIEFAFGRTAVTLHFRKKRKNVFEELFR